MTAVELQLWKDDLLVAGVDEAGCGPLAGPVVAAVVILPPFCEIKVRDSKTLTPTARESLFQAIKQHAVDWCYGWASPEEVARFNIRYASYLAMLRAIKKLKVKPNMLLVDGYEIPYELPFPQQGIVKGDAKSLNIAAASIVAKVIRDRVMEIYDIFFPDYGFAQHKGYPTREHINKLLQLGPLPIYRVNYKPVRKVLTIEGVLKWRSHPFIQSGMRVNSSPSAICSLMVTKYCHVTTARNAVSWTSSATRMV